MLRGFPLDAGQVADGNFALAIPIAPRSRRRVASLSSPKRKARSRLQKLRPSSWTPGLSSSMSLGFYLCDMIGVGDADGRERLPFHFLHLLGILVARFVIVT